MMSIKKRLMAVAATIILLSLFVGSQKAVMGELPVELTSSEYKLLLNPDRFGTFEEGFDACWEIVKKVATDNGAKIVEYEDRLDEIEYEQIAFFDTPNQDLLKHGYVLRVKYSFDGDKNRKPGATYSLKARSKDRQEVLKADPRIAEGYSDKKAKLEFESDVVYFSDTADGRETFYSNQSKIKFGEELGDRFGVYSDLFPVLSTFGVDPSTPVRPVAGVVIPAHTYEPGDIVFGEGLVCEVSMTVWNMEVGDSLFVIPELSYSHSYEKGVEIPEEAMELNVRFLDLLRDAAPEWAVPGQTKSSYLFEYDAEMRGGNAGD